MSPDRPVNSPADPVFLDDRAAARCRRRVHLDHDPQADRARRRAPDDGVVLRRENNAAHRRRLQQLLVPVAADGSGMTPPVAVPDPATPGEQWPALIWGPTLRANGRIVTPELLVREVDGGYVPVLARGHRTLNPGSGAELTDLTTLQQWAASYPSSPQQTYPAAVLQTYPAAVSREWKRRRHHDDALALAHAYRTLQQLGLASDRARGGIIGLGHRANDGGRDDAEVIVWHRLDAPRGDAGSALDDYDARFADRLAVATAAARGDPALAQPSKIAECRHCPWWTVCGPELEAAHDVSLLSSGADADVFRAVGARTYDDVAAMAQASVGRLPISGIPAGEARVRARAMVAGVPLVRRRDAVDPVRADVELDVDMESYGDDGAYLWGTHLSGTPVAVFEQGYHPFMTWQPLDSAGAAVHFVEFWHYLRRLRHACAAAGLSFAAYCYSRAAEQRWFYGTQARFPEVTGMPTRREIDRFCASRQWVDLYQEIKRLFVVPGSMRLKTVAPIAGFAWRDEEPGGENSMAWYRVAAGYDASDPVEVEGCRARILRYNEDDCLATLRLRQWMSDRSEEMPTVAELDRRWRE